MTPIDPPIPEPTGEGKLTAEELAARGLQPPSDDVESARAELDELQADAHAESERAIEHLTAGQRLRSRHARSLPRPTRPPTTTRSSSPRRPSTVTARTPRPWSSSTSSARSSSCS
jgi:hypothetical protein